MTQPATQIKRSSCDKDEMVTKSTNFGGASNPAQTQVIKSFVADADGQVLGVSTIQTALGMFYLYVNQTLKFAWGSGVAGGDFIEIPGRADYLDGDTIAVIAAVTGMTGAYAAAIIYADA